MDIFRLLSRGANIKKSATNKKYINNIRDEKPSNNSTEESRLESTIDKELDFFHTLKKKLKLLDMGKNEADNKDNEKEESDSDSDDNDDDEPQEEDDIYDTNIFSEENIEKAKQLRKSRKVKITGEDIPLPLFNFEDLVKRYGILASNGRLLENLMELGFVNPTPIQSESIPMILNHRDLLACSPTGSGKTLSFLIPVLISILQKESGRKNTKLQHKNQVIIITPTKDLATQIHQEALKLTKGLNLSINVKLLNKNTANKFKTDLIKPDKFDLLISTPLRLNELLSVGKLSIENLKTVIFDEADKLFDKDFVSQVDTLLDNFGSEKLNQLQKIMFSATIPSHVEEICESLMNVDYIRLIIGNKQAANLNIEQKLVFCGNEQGKLLEIRNMILNSEFKPPIIIFLQSIIRAKALYHELLYDNLKVDAIHSERTPAQRNQVINDFKQGKVWCLICTDVLARGIDFKNVNIIINYDVPKSSSDYIHRIGRTGRNGNMGKAYTFYTKEDTVALKSIVNVVKQSNNNLESWMDDLTKISKKEKKNLKYKQIQREKISTVPKIVSQKRKRRQQMINDSKKRSKNS